jgi:uncharacterized membrane protein YedE/YeeE
MAGYCPGPAVVSLGLGVREASVFLAAMLGGMALFRWFTSRAAEPLESVAHE